MDRLHIISATRQDPVNFSRFTRLGTSLKRMSFDDRIISSIAYSNKEGLGAVFNRALDAVPDNDTLLFMHDDVFIDDYFMKYRLDHAFQHFDVVGLAGNTRPCEGHVAWCFFRDANNVQKWYDKSVMSGWVCHALPLGEVISEYGPSPQPCVLLDGFFICVAARTLRQRGVRFDERFPFHFYDMDFCRSCRAAGLRLGTWPISVTHGSEGRFNQPDWEAALAVYRQKWSSVPIATHYPT